MKGIISLIFIIFFFNICYSQSHQSVSGIVFNAKSGLRIGSILVKNTRSGDLTRTNDHGEFKIFVSQGDNLELNAEGYTADRVIIEDFKDKVIQLQAQNSLPEVVVKASSISRDLQEVGNSYVSKGIFYKGKPPLALLSPFGGSPLTFFYELSSKDALQARRFGEYSTREQEHAEISKRYNDKVITSLLAIQVRDIQEFKKKFRPSINQIREWNDIELYDYIKRCYKKFVSKP